MPVRKPTTNISETAAPRRKLDVGRIRTVKPELFQSATLAQGSDLARLYFIGLFTLVDDEGRMLYVPKMVVGLLWPYNTEVTASVVEKLTLELVKQDAVRLYEVGPVRYLYLPNWHKHQVIHRPTASKFPPPPEFPLSTPEFPLSTPEVPQPEEEEEVEVEVEVEVDVPAPKAADKPKTKRKCQFPAGFVFEERMREWTTAVRAVQQGANLEDEFDRFRNWHTAKGSLMMDWPAAFKTWLGNYRPRPGGAGAVRGPTGEPMNRFEAWIAQHGNDQSVYEATGVEAPDRRQLNEG
jgi:hypothetical protein